MRIKVKRQPLFEKVSLVAGLTEMKSPKDIVSNILFRGSKKTGQFFIAATDFETTIVSFFTGDTVPDADSVSFDILIPAHAFLDILRQIDEKEVNINVHKSSVEIEIPSASARFKIPSLSGKDFPKIPIVSSKNTFKIPIPAISEALPSVLNFSSQKGNFRRNIESVLFEPFGDDMIRFVATDSHRLAYFQRKIDGGVDPFEKTVVSKKAVGEMAKLLKAGERGKEVASGAKDDSFAELFFGEKKVFFTVGETTLISTPVDSSFPDYVKVIPDFSSLKPIVVEKEKMLRTVKRVGVFCQELKKINLDLDLETPSSPTLRFSSDETESGQGSELVPVDCEGGELSVAFNPDFLLDSLNFLDGNKVEFYPGEQEKKNASAAVFALPDTKDFVCVVMPIVN